MYDLPKCVLMLCNLDITVNDHFHENDYQNKSVKDLKYWKKNFFIISNDNFDELQL